MKIINLYRSDETIIRKALLNDSKAERELYERYAPKMLSVCRFYIKDLHYAEDVMVQAFTRAFDNLGRFRFEGSFEGWLRRIMVREAIDFEEPAAAAFTEIEEAETLPVMVDEPDLDADLLQILIDNLPEGYRTVLVLFAIDGYSHKEIAAMLGISESTSKSQLFKARRQLQEQLSSVKRKENERI